MGHDERQIVERILTDTASFYHRNIPAGIRSYLTEIRGFSENTIERFKIGYAGGALRDHLINDLHYPAELCLKAGVLKKTDGGEIQDYFNDRIIFPNGRRDVVVHLTGRSIGDIEPKYLHLPGAMAHLYNEDALDQKEVMITEGAPDCLTAVEAGYAAVAVLGAGNFKPEYVPKFSRCEKVYICMDGDSAGEAGAQRIGQFLPNKSYVVQLPEGKDLNEFMRDHSTGELNQLVRSSKRILSYILDKIPGDTDKAELPRRLDHLLNTLSRMSLPEAEHFLEHEIKPRFSLTGDEIKAYRKFISDRRRATVSKKKASSAQGEQRVQYRAKFDGLVDLVLNNNGPEFLIKTGDGISTRSHVDLDGDRNIPPPKTTIPWILPRSGQVIAAFDACRANPSVFCQRLYDDIVHRLKDVSDLPDDSYYELLASWCFHTYLLEGVQYSPIICLFAVPERGKSRTGKALIHLAYRGIHVESLREAYIYRVADYFDSSIFFDVRDIWRKAEKAGSEDILLQRFEKGAKVPRVLYPEEGPHKDIVYYSIFGPTIIATNEGIDPILETRSVYINMPEARRGFESDVVPEGSLELKERLTAFRAWHLGQILPEALKPASGRLGDILKPLLQVIRLVNPQKEAAFLDLVGRLNRERLLDKSSSLDAEILKTIYDLSDFVCHGSLAVKRITEQLNLERPERMKLSPQRIGRRLKAMGFRKVRTANGAAAIEYDAQQIGRMFAGFGLEETSETSDSSEPRANTPSVTDDSDQSDG